MVEKTLTWRNFLRSYIPEPLKAVFRSWRAMLKPDPWAVHIAKLFQRDIQPLLSTGASGPEQQMVLFWTPMAPWPHMFIEYALATNLRLRGYQVLFCVCDGGLPHCEMERSQCQRPQCYSCSRLTKDIMETFQFSYKTLSDFVPKIEMKTVIKQMNQEKEKNLRSLILNDIEVGIYSYQYLNTYFNGPITEYGPKEQSIFRDILTGNVLAQIYAERVAQQYQPQAVVMLNGNLCQTFPAFHVFQQRGTRVITWDDYPPYQDSFLFLQNRTVAAGEIDETSWAQISQDQLSVEQEAKVDRFLQDLPAGRLSDIVYHPQPETELHQIRQKLGLDSKGRLFVAFSNVVWDSAALGQNVGFASMMDWLYTLCEWFIQHHRDQLLIRIHPAEKRLPAMYRTINGVAGLIRQRYGDKLQQGNIAIVEADDDLYSYTLAEMADAIGVYTSTIGMEMAARGILPWVAGKVHYRSKGFTLDVRNADHLFDLLNQRVWNSRVTDDGIVLVKRYLYLRFERQITRIPFLTRNATVHKRPFLEGLNFMSPGHDPLVDSLVDRVLDGKPFLDVPRKSMAKVVG